MPVLMSAACLALLACGGDGGTDPTDPTPTPVAIVDLSLAADTLQAGDTLRIVAKPRSATEELLQGRTVTWKSTNPSVATIDDAGLVTAVNQGATTILATAEGVTSAASIAVVVGVTGTWAGHVDADGQICHLTQSLTEALDGNLSGAGISGLGDELCIHASYTVSGVNNVDGMPNQVHMVLSFEEGDLVLDGEFDGIATMSGFIEQEGCTSDICSWVLTRTGITPTPISLLQGNRSQP
jgi:hypothetical protein